MMLGPYFSKNGELLPIEKALIPLENIEYSYGFGAYENLKVRKRILYFLELHIDRLFFSARQIGLKIPFDKKAIQKNTIELIRKIKEDSFNIKLLLIGNKQGSDLYIMALAPSFIPKKSYSQGVKVITHEAERQFPQAKTLNMLSSYLAYRKAKENWAYDALLIDREDRILEGTRTNFFYTDGKTIFTSPKDLVLNGVTRITLMEALIANKISIKEKMLKKDELQDYEGFFLTSTSAKVLPISRIDEATFQIPQIIKDALKAYERYLTEYEQKQNRIEYQK